MLLGALKPDQIHLEAIENTKLVNNIYEAIKKGNYDDSMKIQIAEQIRFFGKNVEKLQESNEATLTLARSFLLTTRIIQWSIRDSNAFLLMIIRLLLKRKDEVIIREACVIMKEFTKQLSRPQLKHLVTIHKKPAELLFHKMSKVQTYQTQLALLDILKTFLKSLADGGVSVIQNEKILSLCSPSLIQTASNAFNCIDENDFMNTSRVFLNCYNSEVIKSPFIRTMSGFLLQVNKKAITDVISIFIDFNLRNLSISLIIGANTLKSSNKEEFNTSTVLVEMEDCDVSAEKHKFKNPGHIELSLKPKRLQILGENVEPVFGLDHIESMILVLSDERDAFMNDVYPSYKEKTPMMLDFDYFTDNESLISFRTIDSFIKPVSKPKQQEVAIVNRIFEKAEPLPEVKPMKPTREPSISPELFTPQGSLVTSQHPAEKQRKTAMVGPTNHNILNQRQIIPDQYDDISDDNDVLPSASKFLSAMRSQRPLRDLAAPLPEAFPDNILTAMRNQRMLRDLAGGLPEAFPDNIEGRMSNRPTTSKKAIAKKRSPRNKKSRAAKKNNVKTRGGRTNKNDIVYSSEIDEEIVRVFGEALSSDSSEIVVPTAKSKRQTIVAQQQFSKSTLESKTKPFKENAPLPNRNQQPIKSNPKRTQKPLFKAVPESPVIIPVKQVTKIKRSAPEADENMAPLVKKSRPNFDEWLGIRKPLAISKPSEIPQQKKQVMFDEPLHYMHKKRSTQSVDHSHDHSKRLENQARSNVSFNSYTPQRVQHEEPNEEPQVVHNYEELQNNQLLEKFLTDCRQQSQDGSFDEIVITNTKRIQTTKTSPKTVIRTVEVQEISGSPPGMPQNVLARRTEDITYKQPNATQTLVPRPSTKESDLCNLYLIKADKALAPLQSELKKINASSGEVALNSNTKRKVLEAVDNCRETKERVHVHANEHIKLLKRLHHSKRQLMQYQDMNVENLEKLKEAVKHATVESRKTLQVRVKNLEKIRDEALSKDKAIKTDIWKQYMGSVANQFQEIMQYHAEF